MKDYVAKYGHLYGRVSIILEDVTAMLNEAIEYYKEGQNNYEISWEMNKRAEIRDGLADIERRLANALKDSDESFDEQTSHHHQSSSTKETHEE